jgi:hypothetical protein
MIPDRGGQALTSVLRSRYDRKLPHRTPFWTLARGRVLIELTSHSHPTGRGEHSDGGWIVNLRVFVDTPAAPLSKASVRLFEEPTVDPAVEHTAWWPPRI